MQRYRFESGTNLGNHDWRGEGREREKRGRKITKLDGRRTDVERRVQPLSIDPNDTDTKVRAARSSTRF